MKALPAVAVILALLVPAVAFAHGGDHVMGTIKAFEKDTLTVTATDGDEVSIQLTAETKIFMGEEEVSRDEIEVGSRVVVKLAEDKTASEVHLPKAE